MSAWAGVGAAYDASFAALCAGTNDEIVDAVGASGAKHVLDVGSGTGALARALAEADLRVIAAEPDASMRAVAGARHPGLSFVDAGLPSLPFADHAFDAVTANFVLNHVDDPRASAREMARVAIPDGLMIATMWTSAHGWFWASVCERTGIAPVAGERLPVELDFERSAEGFGTMLREGGWQDVRGRELAWTWRTDAAELWASIEGGVATAGAFYRSLDPEARAGFRSGFDLVCAEHAIDGAIGLDHVAALAVGRAAGPA